MLGQVSSDHDEEFIKSIQIGDLSIGTKDIPVDSPDQAELLEGSNRPPECSLTGPGVLGDLRLLGVDLAVVSPQPEELEGDRSLFGGQPQGTPETVDDVVPLLKEQLG